MKDAQGLTRREVAVLMASIVRRYRRGEISERTANRETLMLKTLVDSMEKGGLPVEVPLTPEGARALHAEMTDRIVTLVMKDHELSEKMRAALQETER